VALSLRDVTLSLNANFKDYAYKRGQAKLTRRLVSLLIYIDSPFVQSPRAKTLLFVPAASDQL